MHPDRNMLGTHSPGHDDVEIPVAIEIGRVSMDDTSIRVVNQVRNPMVTIPGVLEPGQHPAMLPGRGRHPLCGKRDPHRTSQQIKASVTIKVDDLHRPVLDQSAGHDVPGPRLACLLVPRVLKPRQCVTGVAGRRRVGIAIAVEVPQTNIVSPGAFPADLVADPQVLRSRSRLFEPEQMAIAVADHGDVGPTIPVEVPQGMPFEPTVLSGLHHMPPEIPAPIVFEPQQ